MNLIGVKRGDLVIFKNGDEREVRNVHRYDSLLDIIFDKPVFGRLNTSLSRNYFLDGRYQRDDLDEWANDIVKIIKKDVDTQVAAE